MDLIVVLFLCILQNLYNFWAEPNSLTTLRLSGTESALENVSVICSSAGCNLEELMGRRVGHIPICICAGCNLEELMGRRVGHIPICICAGCNLEELMGRRVGHVPICICAGCNLEELMVTFPFLKVVQINSSVPLVTMWFLISF